MLPFVLATCLQILVLSKGQTFDRLISSMAGRGFFPGNTIRQTAIGDQFVLNRNLVSKNTLSGFSDRSIPNGFSNSLLSATQTAKKRTYRKQYSKRQKRDAINKSKHGHGHTGLHYHSNKRSQLSPRKYRARKHRRMKRIKRQATQHLDLWSSQPQSKVSPSSTASRQGSRNVLSRSSTETGSRQAPNARQFHKHAHDKHLPNPPVQMLSQRPSEKRVFQNENAPLQQRPIPPSRIPRNGISQPPPSKTTRPVNSRIRSLQPDLQHAVQFSPSSVMSVLLPSSPNKQIQDLINQVFQESNLSPQSTNAGSSNGIQTANMPVQTIQRQLKDRKRKPAKVPVQNIQPTELMLGVTLPNTIMGVTLPNEMAMNDSPVQSNTNIGPIPQLLSNPLQESPVIRIPANKSPSRVPQPEPNAFGKQTNSRQISAPQAPTQQQPNWAMQASNRLPKTRPSTNSVPNQPLKTKQSTQPLDIARQRFNQAFFGQQTNTEALAMNVNNNIPLNKPSSQQTQNKGNRRQNSGVSYQALLKPNNIVGTQPAAQHQVQPHDQVGNQQHDHIHTSGAQPSHHHGTFPQSSNNLQVRNADTQTNSPIRRVKRPQQPSSTQTDSPIRRVSNAKRVSNKNHQQSYPHTAVGNQPTQFAASTGTQRRSQHTHNSNPHMPLSPVHNNHAAIYSQPNGINNAPLDFQFQPVLSEQTNNQVSNQQAMPQPNNQAPVYNAQLPEPTGKHLQNHRRVPNKQQANTIGHTITTTTQPAYTQPVPYAPSPTNPVKVIFRKYDPRRRQRQKKPITNTVSQGDTSMPTSPVKFIYRKYDPRRRQRRKKPITNNLNQGEQWAGQQGPSSIQSNQPSTSQQYNTRANSSPVQKPGPPIQSQSQQSQHKQYQSSPVQNPGPLLQSQSHQSYSNEFGSAKAIPVNIPTYTPPMVNSPIESLLSPVSLWSPSPEAQSKQLMQSAWNHNRAPKKAKKQTHSPTRPNIKKNVVGGKFLKNFFQPDVFQYVTPKPLPEIKLPPKHANGNIRSGRRSGQRNHSHRPRQTQVARHPTPPPTQPQFIPTTEATTTTTYMTYPTMPVTAPQLNRQPYPPIQPISTKPVNKNIQNHQHVPYVPMPTKPVRVVFRNYDPRRRRRQKKPTASTTQAYPLPPTTYPPTMPPTFTPTTTTTTYQIRQTNSPIRRVNRPQQHLHTQTNSPIKRIKRPHQRQNIRANYPVKIIKPQHQPLNTQTNSPIRRVNRPQQPQYKQTDSSVRKIKGPQPAQYTQNNLPIKSTKLPQQPQNTPINRTNVQQPQYTQTNSPFRRFNRPQQPKLTHIQRNRQPKTMPRASNLTKHIDQPYHVQNSQIINAAQQGNQQPQWRHEQRNRIAKHTAKKRAKGKRHRQNNRRFSKRIVKNHRRNRQPSKAGRGQNFKTRSGRRGPVVKHAKRKNPTTPPPTVPAYTTPSPSMVPTYPTPPLPTVPTYPTPPLPTVPTHPTPPSPMVPTYPTPTPSMVPTYPTPPTPTVPYPTTQSQYNQNAGQTTGFQDSWNQGPTTVSIANLPTAGGFYPTTYQTNVNGKSNSGQWNNAPTTVWPEPQPVKNRGQPLSPNTNSNRGQPLSPNTNSNRGQPLSPNTNSNRGQPLSPNTNSNQGQPLSPNTNNNRGQPLSPNTNNNRGQPLSANTNNNREQPLSPNTNSNSANPQQWNMKMEANVNKQQNTQVKNDTKRVRNRTITLTQVIKHNNPSPAVKKGHAVLPNVQTPKSPLSPSINHTMTISNPTKSPSVYVDAGNSPINFNLILDFLKRTPQPLPVVVPTTPSSLLDMKLWNLINAFNVIENAGTWLPGKMVNGMYVPATDAPDPPKKRLCACYPKKPGCPAELKEGVRLPTCDAVIQVTCCEDA